MTHLLEWQLDRNHFRDIRNSADVCFVHILQCKSFQSNFRTIRKSHPIKLTCFGHTNLEGMLNFFAF